MGAQSLRRTPINDRIRSFDVGYSMLVCKKGSIPAGSMIGEFLTEKHLKGTTYEIRQEIDLVLHSIGIVFSVPITWEHVTGSVADTEVVNSLSALARNN